MARTIKPATQRDHARVTVALAYLQEARDHLKSAGASRRCVDRVRLAISSAKGALRHVRHRAMKEDR